MLIDCFRHPHWNIYFSKRFLHCFIFIGSFNIYIAGKTISNKSNSSGFLNEIRILFSTWYYLLCDLLQLCLECLYIYDITIPMKKRTEKIKANLFRTLYISYISRKYLKAVVRHENSLNLIYFIILAWFTFLPWDFVTFKSNVQ